MSKFPSWAAWCGLLAVCLFVVACGSASSTAGPSGAQSGSGSSALESGAPAPSPSPSPSPSPTPSASPAPGDDDDDDNEVEFTGAIESIGTSSLVVAGRTVLVDASTRIEGDASEHGGGDDLTLSDLAVGDVLEVEGDEQADGSVLARKIELEDDHDGDDDDDSDDDDDDDDDDEDDEDDEDDGDGR